MSGEKTEKPTAKKIEDAKKKGDIPRSKELGSVATLIFAFFYLQNFGAGLWQHLCLVFAESLDFKRFVLMSASDIKIVLFDIFKNSLLALAPFLLVILLIGIASNSLLGGFSFTASKLAPDLKKLNPISGIKKMFSAEKLVELIKSVMKAAIVAIPMYFILPTKFFHFMSTMMMFSINDSVTIITHNVISAGLLFSSLFIVVVVLDVPYQVYSYMKRLKMSKQDIKDEYKQSEGNPEIKGRRRSMQLEMSRKASGSKVQDADMIITNPTHYAVGIKYNPEVDDVPVIVSLGADAIALAHRARASDLGIPILEIPPLARVLYKTCSLNDEVPPELYSQMAMVIRAIYALDDRLSFKVTESFVNSLNVNEEEFI
ncbi:flagellar biosynthesis protein FlhB [Photobacterium kishitanii]|uniref:Flagellar biosynthetic protein FlhB n=1 Tax=Photobacterium kishitanii TaxID=318456 RepID=A0A2T3KMU7_9GAMM|nr:flagellar biosynthesis protein FlhB [Photobacterium kishitanii]PSV01102.1 flagellar biosynthesis protein FlhB [Photobacterium kishitanii]